MGVAFENCTSLKSVAVMKDTDVSMGAFDGCDSLESFFCYKDSPADSFCSTLGIDPTYFDDGYSVEASYAHGIKQQERYLLHGREIRQGFYEKAQ